MAPQNESDPKSGNEETQVGDKQTTGQSSRGTDLESEQLRPEPYAIDDPQRADRISALSSETAGVLEQVQATPVGFDDLTPEQLRYVHEDAVERSEWSEARQDAFVSILRLGRKVPPRSKRIL